MEINYLEFFFFDFFQVFLVDRLDQFLDQLRAGLGSDVLIGDVAVGIEFVDFRQLQHFYIVLLDVGTCCSPYFFYWFCII